MEKLHNEELNDQYSSPSNDQIEKNKMGGACSTYGGEVLVGKLDRKGPLGRSGRRWEDNIKMDHQEVGCLTWTGSIWLR